MSFEANKILGAILAAGILAMISGIIANILVHPIPLAKQAYEVAGGPPEGAAGAAAAAAPAGPEPIAPLMEKASADAGKAKSQLCAACHSFDKGGPNRIGPNLYGVVGRQVASVAGFNYSAPLKAMGGTWSFDALNKWLIKPSADVPGTAMTFSGITNEKQRADVIAYLDSLSANPVPLPKAEGSAAPAGAEPAKQ